MHTVKRETLRDVARASGTIVPSTAGDWTIFAPEEAEIVELTKSEGEAVVTGDLLLGLVDRLEERLDGLEVCPECFVMCGGHGSHECKSRRPCAHPNAERTRASWTGGFLLAVFPTEARSRGPGAEESGGD